MKTAQVQIKSVLVTGCSSGIGLAAAHYLRERGWLVVPTARKPEDLEKLKREGFAPVSLDLTSGESIRLAVQNALAITGGGLGGLVNNAGFGQAGAMEDVSREALRYQFEVNFFGTHDLTRQLIPVFRRQGWGRIVNISSVLGRIAMPMLGSYSASKFALEAWSDALRRELRKTGLGVSVVEPGPILSEFRRNAAKQSFASLDLSQSTFGEYYDQKIRKRLDRPIKAEPFTLGPEAVAKKIQHALESARPKSRYCVTFPAHAGAWLSRWAPDWLIDAVLSSKVPTAKATDFN